MIWNHRVFSQPDGDEGHYLTIREAYYAKKSDAVPNMWTSDGVRVGGSDLKEVRSTLERMLKCLSLPILELDKKGNLK